VEHVPPDAQVLVWGRVLSGMKPGDPPVTGEKKASLMPLAWAHEFTGESGKVSRIFATTAGAAVDLQNEGLRRMLVNACYWGLGMEAQLPDKSDVTLVGDYNPTFFGFGKGKKGLKPSDFK
jgi:hypothetical protein